MDRRKFLFVTSIGVGAFFGTPPVFAESEVHDFSVLHGKYRAKIGRKVAVLEFDKGDPLTYKYGSNGKTLVNRYRNPGTSYPLWREGNVIKVSVARMTIQKVSADGSDFVFDWAYGSSRRKGLVMIRD